MTDTLILPENPTLKDFQDYIRKVCDIRGFNKTDPVWDMLSLTEEIGELARVIRRTHKNGHTDINKSYDLDIAGELTDCFMFLANIANMYNIDLEKAFREKEEKNKKRTWKKN